MAHVDVCVVGAGIVGLAHALEARRRGLRVAVLERDLRATGASVRNFGHGFVSALADGEPFACGLRARERWLEYGRRAGLEISTAGSLVIARHPDELSAIEAFARDPARDAQVLTAEQAAALAPIATAGVLGALHCRLDIRVDPRAAVAGLARLLEDDPQATVHWDCNVSAIEPGIVHGSRVSVHAPMIVLCPGPDYGALAPELQPTRPGLTRVKLQMLRVAAPGGAVIEPALLTGLSLLRYPAFSELPETEPVRRRLTEERPELLDAGIHLIVTQQPNGELIIGDTHDYGDTVAPFGEERLDELVLAEARALLGAGALEVRERWHGVYPTAPGDPFLVQSPIETVHVVEVVNGIGMTTALGLAPAVLDELLTSQRAAQPRHAGTRAGSAA